MSKSIQIFIVRFPLQGHHSNPDGLGHILLCQLPINNPDAVPDQKRAETPAASHPDQFNNIDSNHAEPFDPAHRQ